MDLAVDDPWRNDPDVQSDQEIPISLTLETLNVENDVVPVPNGTNIQISLTFRQIFQFGIEA